MEFGMSCRMKPNEKYVRISMKEVWRNFDGPLKNNEFVELRSGLNLVGRKWLRYDLAGVEFSL